MKRALITGGAGFIGANLANRLLLLGYRVRILDNLSRAGSEKNLEWLRQVHRTSLELRIADIRNPEAVREAVQDIDEVFHFAAQVAVTTSVTDPMKDFSVNAGGTLILLEALRSLRNPPGLIFTSTNKVYGALNDLRLARLGTRYAPLDGRHEAVDERRPLDFHSPYGCSKGAADQYVLDYSRIYGLPTVVFRMSCIYGPHQSGTEDQGWVAHFMKLSLARQPLTIYGDGAQLRDILFVDDLLDAAILAQARIRELSGSAFNIGGGPRNTISLLELMNVIQELTGRRPSLKFEDWRPGDQRYYVSDYSRFQEATGWEPAVGVREGIRQLQAWIVAQSSQTTAAVGSAMEV